MLKLHCNRRLHAEKLSWTERLDQDCKREEQGSKLAAELDRQSHEFSNIPEKEAFLLDTNQRESAVRFLS
jgi:hypothetical protein